MKLVKLILAILVLAVSISAQTVITDNDSVTVKTDADANTVGKFEVQTSNVPRVTILPSGEVGIGAPPTAGKGLFQFPPAVIGGALNVMRFPVPDPAGSDFQIRMTSVPFAGQLYNGVPRETQDLIFGYNCHGQSQNMADSSLCLSWEMFYLGYGEGDVDEFHLIYSRPGGPPVRVGSGLFNRDNDKIRLNIKTDSFTFSDPTGANENWLSVISGPAASYMNLAGDSRIDFAGNTREYFLTVAGTGLMGKTGNNFDLFSGGITGETVRFFKGSDLSAPLTIKIGSLGSGFRIGSSQRMQVSGNGINYFDILTTNDVDAASTANKIVQRDSNGAINTTAVKIGDVQVLAAPCAAISDPPIESRFNNLTTQAILNCLRQHGLLATQ